MHLYCEVKLRADVVQSFHRRYYWDGSVSYVEIDIGLSRIRKQ